MIVLDTPVLVYALGSDHPLREPCRALLVAGSLGAVRLATTVEVVQEFAHVWSRRRDRADAARLASAYADALDLMQSDPDDLRTGLGLFARHERLGSFDAVLAALAMRTTAPLVSADRAFAHVPGLTWIDPASPALYELMRAQQ